MTTDTDHDALRTYLNDHLAGSTLGADHARQLEEMLDGEPEAQTMADVANEIDEDREILLGLMGRLGASKNPVKAATAWVAEKAGRIKFSGVSSQNRALGIFLALETMSLGVEGKRDLWIALRTIATDVPELGTVDLDDLIARAESQRSRLETMREKFARRALLDSETATVS
ncbi:MAG: hypothetical protein QOH00_3121 [Gaiellales bacterium]|jgi:hypothetical protein|nr:hypothetical protein [Gaiellales bacterium]